MMASATSKSCGMSATAYASHMAAPKGADMATAEAADMATPAKAFGMTATAKASAAMTAAAAGAIEAVAEPVASIAPNMIVAKIVVDVFIIHSCSFCFLDLLKAKLIWIPKNTPGIIRLVY